MPSFNSISASVYLIERKGPQKAWIFKINGSGYQVCVAWCMPRSMLSVTCLALFLFCLVNIGCVITKLNFVTYVGLSWPTSLFLYCINLFLQILDAYCQSFQQVNKSAQSISIHQPHHVVKSQTLMVEDTCSGIQMCRDKVFPHYCYQTITIFRFFYVTLVFLNHRIFSLPHNFGHVPCNSMFVFMELFYFCRRHPN